MHHVDHLEALEKNYCVSNMTQSVHEGLYNIHQKRRMHEDIVIN